METTVEAISKEVMTLPEQAKMVLVKDAESMARGNQLFLVIKGLRKKIDDTFDPIISKAHEAHKEAINQKKKIEEPLIIASNWLNVQMSAYKQEQDRIRREEEEKLRQIAIKEEMERRKAEEKRRMEEAAALEQAGAKEEAEQVMAEIIQEMEAPVIVAPPPPSIPKVELKGMASKTYWSADVFDLFSLVKAIAKGEQPLNYVEASMTPLNKQAQSLHENMKIPGVRPISRSSMAGTGR